MLPLLYKIDQLVITMYMVMGHFCGDRYSKHLTRNDYLKITLLMISSMCVCVTNAEYCM